MKKRLDDCNNEEKKLISCGIQATIYMSIKHGSFLSNIGDVLHVRVPVFFVCVVAQQHVFGSLKCKETEKDCIDDLPCRMSITASVMGSNYRHFQVVSSRQAIQRRVRRNSSNIHVEWRLYWREAEKVFHPLLTPGPLSTISISCIRNDFVRPWSIISIILNDGAQIFFS